MATRVELKPVLAWQRTVASTKTLLFWKIITAFLAFIITVQWFATPRSAPRRPRPVPRPLPPIHHGIKHDSDSQLAQWSYMWQRDHDNSALSMAQCDTAFPDLYFEIDRAIKYWSTREITSDTVDLTMNSGVRVRIKNGQLHIVKSIGLHSAGDFRARLIGVLNQVKRALTGALANGIRFKDTEFTIITDDYPAYPEDRNMTWWTWTRNKNDPKHESMVLVPDFNFWAIPPVSGAYAEMQRKAREHDAAIIDKIPKAFWRGVTWTNPEIREALVNRAKNKSWADVKVISWEKGQTQDIIPLDEFCKYAYLINTEGRAWSSRLTYGLNCDSVAVIHDLDWIAHYYHLLEPGVNYIGVKRDFSDLAPQMDHFMAHPEEAQVIADNARHTFRETYTSPAAEACYWRKLIHSWGEISFTPTEDLPSIMFEDFILHDNGADYPWPK